MKVMSGTKSNSILVYKIVLKSEINWNVHLKQRLRVHNEAVNAMRIFFGQTPNG